MAASRPNENARCAEASGVALPWHVISSDDDGTTREGRLWRRLQRISHIAGEVVGETLWTTRCIICDAPGTLLCGRCRLLLPYIDRWMACPRCGAPDGFLQCTECNSLALDEVGRCGLPFDGCVSVIEHRGIARSIITGFKDAGEQRLGAVIALMLSRVIPRSWLEGPVALSYIPADSRARRRRGFDHMRIVAESLAPQLGLPCLPLLEKDAAADQRGLSRRERFENMSGRFHLLRPSGERATLPREVLLIDDVHTTGATLFAACDALQAAGIRRIRCTTFARAM